MDELPDEIRVLQERCADEQVEEVLRRLGVHVVNKQLIYGEGVAPQVTITANVGRLAFSGPELPVTDEVARDVDATVDEFLDVRSRFQAEYGSQPGV